MDAGRKWGTLGGLFGISFGGLCWLVIVGIAVESVLYTILPVLAMGTAIGGGWILLHRFPERPLWPIAFSLLCVGFAGLILGNLLYERIPDVFMGQPTNKETMGRAGINLFMGVALLVGIGLLIGSWLFHRRRTDPTEPPSGEIP